MKFLKFSFSAISRRKLEMDVESVIKAINTLDLKTLSLENVELLQKMVPTEQESKIFKDYVIEKKNINLLTEEDKFVLNLTKVERISSKLSIMSYMGNFFDSLHLISPVSFLNYPSMFSFHMSNFSKFIRSFPLRLR